MLLLKPSMKERKSRAVFSFWLLLNIGSIPPVVPILPLEIVTHLVYQVSEVDRKGLRGDISMWTVKYLDCVPLGGCFS